MQYQELLALPKVELHCHLDGSLTQGFIEEMVGHKVEPSDLEVDEDCHDLAECLAKFDLPISCLQTAKGLRLAGHDFIKSVAAENVKYVEVRFAPQQSTFEGLKLTEVLETVIEGLRLGSDETGVKFNVIACAMRHHSYEQNLQMLRAAREFLGQGVCAADLAGDEASYPMGNFIELFDQVKKLEMPYTIHAGECGKAENIALAVSGGARRIGHGVAMSGHSDIIRECIEKRIGVEMCPKSNLQTKSATVATYPLREFINAGVLVNINTDNRTVSNTTLTKELEFIQSHYGITDDEIRMLQKNAVEVSFADDAVKDELYKII